MALRPGFLPPYPAPNQPNRQTGGGSPTLQSGPSGPIGLGELLPDNVNRPLVINLQTPQLFVASQPPVQVVFNNKATSPSDGTAFAWWKATPLAIYIVNSQDVAALVEIHGNMSPDTSSRLPIPLRSIQVGPGLRRLITLNPQGADQWAPYVWPVVSGVGTATAGNVVVQMSTPV